jgi:aquaporin Z
MNQVGSGRILAAEAVGTAILVMGGPGTAVLAGNRVGVLGVALAFGFSLLVAAYLVGSVSGCHVNPAVTLAMWLTRKVTTTQAVVSVIGQVLGGVAGAAVIYGVASGRPGFERGSFASNGWAQLSLDGYNLGAVIVVEVVFTAVLVAVVVATTNKSFPAAMGPVAAGLTLAVIHLITIPVDGTSVNPVRSLSTALFSDWDTDHLQQLWVFIVFPLVGAVVGVVAWLVVDDATLESTMLDTVQTRYVRDLADDLADDVVDKIEDATD